ncbi:MAG: hypothetical protein IPK16_04380 [Anaerolineales bacterium]|nr:hypothetical protein [Anaerolineales bacterium]
MNSVYLAMSAWREILARIFTGFTEQDNVSPDWLVNPATNRKLKLDKYYPDAAVAIRFIGLTAKGQGRMSDWEVMETEQRDQTRAELCRQNGVQLVTVDPAEDIIKQLDGLLSALARASRLLAQSKKPDKIKTQWMPALASARDRAEKLRGMVAKNAEQMTANLADSWRDREAGIALELGSSTLATNPTTTAPAAPLVLASGQRVRHVKFGDGVITRIDGAGDVATVAILFDAAEERTFQAGLLHGKLETIA